MADDSAEFAFEVADRIIDKGFDHLPTKWFGVATPKTSKKLQNGKSDDRYENPSDEEDDYGAKYRRKQNRDYDSRDNRDPYSPSSRNDSRRQSNSTVNRPRGGELPLSSRSDRYGYDDRDFDSFSPRSQRSSQTSRRDQREPASAKDSRPRPHRYRSDRAYESDDEQSRSKKKPNLKIIALGVVAGGLVGAIGSSALQKRRTRKQEEDEVWDKKNGKYGANDDQEDSNSDDEVHGSSRRRERRTNGGASQQSLPLRGDENRSYRRRSMGGR